MGTIFKKKYTKPLPEGAEVFTKKGVTHVRWRGRGGKVLTARLTAGRDGEQRMLVEAATYTAKYRDGAGIVREVSTGCRSKDAAQKVLGDLEKRAEKVRAGIVTSAEDAAMDWQAVLLKEHVDAWVAVMRGRGRTERHCRDMRFKTTRLFKECNFRRLRDLCRHRVEHWLIERASENMPPRTRNGYLGAAVAFCNWAVRAGRMESNPLQGVEKANQQVDRRRVRRALSTKELTALLDAAKRRPLHDATEKNRGPKSAELSEATIEQRLMLGEERRMVYLVLATTGLRKSELASIRIADAHLEGTTPYLELRAESAKNRKMAKIPLRRDVAAEMALHLAKRLKTAQRAAEHAKRPVPVALDMHSSLLPVPDALIKIFRRDLAFGGIKEKDERGRVADVHSLRMTFASHLAAAGVPLRTAQELMRHSDPKLTASIYQDMGILDIAGAVESLPEFTFGGLSVQDARAAEGARNLAPMLAPNSGKGGQNLPNPVKSGAHYHTIRAQHGDTKKTPHLQGFSTPDNAGQVILTGSGARTRTADTWIMIPLL